MSSLVSVSPIPTLQPIQPVSHSASLLSTLFSLSTTATKPLESVSPLLSKRDLPTCLTSIWQRYFSDVAYANEVQIGYCRAWKTRLGLIRMTLDTNTSFIGINSLLRSPLVPESVLITTIAHELVHYAHGFGSPLPRLYEHPHAHNVVEKELERRGLGSLLHDCENWIDAQWDDFYANRKVAFSHKNS